MKKTILSIAVIAAAIFAASCQKENLQENTASEGSASVFTATIETGASTKTTVERVTSPSVAYKTYWDNTDKISINGVIYTATPDVTDATKATFAKDPDTQTDPTGTFKAYFPEKLFTQIKGNVIISLPPTYPYVEGKYNMPMYAESDNTTLSFKNLCGVLAITVNGTDFTSVSSIEVSSDKQMNGEFTATAEGVLTFTNKETLTAADKKVTLTFASPKSIASDGSATFYIPVPANTHNPLTIKVFDGAKPKASVTTKGGGVAVERNTVYSITFNPNKTIADILATVEGGFPISSDQTAPENAWTNGGDVSAYRFYSGMTAALYFTKAWVSLSTTVTKVGDSYTTSSSSTPIIFNMTDGILTSFEYKRISGANTNTDGIFYAKPLPVKLTMTPETKENGYNVTINIKGTDILSCSYCFVDMAKYNDGTYKIDSMKDLTDTQLNDVNNSGYSVSVDNCTYSKGYKIVLAVSTSTVSSKSIVAGYYLEKPKN